MLNREERKVHNEDSTWRTMQQWKWVYYALQTVLLFLCLSLKIVFPLQLEIGELICLCVVYILISSSFHRTYHALCVGEVRIRDLVLSQSLSHFFSAGVMYIGTVLYIHSFINPLPLMGFIMVQILISMVWSVRVNRVYFQKRTPPRTAIIYTGEKTLQVLYNSPFFLEKYNVCCLIENPESDLEDIFPYLNDIETVFVTGIPATMENGVVKYCTDHGITAYIVPHLGHILMGGAKYVPTFSVPVLLVERAGRLKNYRVLKRIMDMVLAFVGLIITSPIMLIAAICIKLEDGGPVFFKQTRLTENGREFQILKFRSMIVDAEKDGISRLASTNDSRITRIGKIIRACRVDELPQLINILTGDMSIVGPRPERPEIAREYEKTLPGFALRLQVKAGLTGVAQIYGCYNTTPYTKLQMDLMYITRMDLLYDFKLIVATAKILLKKESTQGVKEGQTTAMVTETSLPSAKDASETVVKIGRYK